MTLRPYQQDAVDAVFRWFGFAPWMPCLIEAPTGAGKSHIIAEIARKLRQQTNKQVLVLAPSKELVLQDFEKFELVAPLSGSIFSASAGQKNSNGNAVFGTPMSVYNALDEFTDGFSAVIIDEAHKITETIKKIIAKLGQIHVVGLSATPYRLGEGYVYMQDKDGMLMNEIHQPFFTRCVYTISARMLIDMGYLTKPVVVQSVEASYDSSQLKLDNFGQYTSESIKATFENSRMTKQVVQDVLHKSKCRKAVLFFAATVEHAKEVLSYLPPAESALIVGSTDAKERAEIIEKFKAKKLKYLVNVYVLTTGFDAPHIDTIALLLATKSVALFQQIAGRGLRIAPGKIECMILDYAQSTVELLKDGDLFRPIISVKKPTDAELIEVVCPACNGVNHFKEHYQNMELFGGTCNKQGFLVDLENKYIKDETYGNLIAGSYGRRCKRMLIAGDKLKQCYFRWTYKLCPSCNEKLDIAARKCKLCKTRMVDPDDKLILEQKKEGKELKSLHYREFVSRNGNEGMRVMFEVEDGEFTSFLMYDVGPFSARAQQLARRIREEKSKLTHIVYSIKDDFVNIKDIQ